MVADMIAALAGPASMLAALALLSVSALRGWRDWLALKRLEMELCAPAQQARAVADVPGPAGVRIEVAALRERIRKLEAIAAGIDP